MGITFVRVTVSNVADEARSAELDLLVDSGATHAVVPRAVLQSIGVVPEGRIVLTLANGERIERDTGIARFRLEKARGGSTVIFGEAGDMALLGVVTLENLGLLLDPLRRELKAMPALLAAFRRRLA